MIYSLLAFNKYKNENIIKQLSDFDLNIKYEPVKKLFFYFKQYIEEDKDIKISIPFPEINRRIKGKLCTNIKEEVTIALIKEKFYTFETFK